MLELRLDIPDLWQQEAVRALRDGCDVVVDAPTGAGKTRIFELLVESGDATRQGQAVYTVPTRALANDKWREWRDRGWNVGITTGDVAENVHAPLVVATLETQRERILSGRAPRLLVVDEYQMIADEKRGLNYELAIALAPPSTQLLLLSGSVRNADDIRKWLERLGRRVGLVRVRERPVPLDEFPTERLPRVAAQGFWQRLAAGAVAARLTPLLIFAPRRAEAEKIARKAAEALPLDPAITLEAEQERLVGRDLARLLHHRVAFHHSGLPYAARAGWVEPLAKNGHLQIIVATTGLAAGINFSVRSVLVASTTYQDGPFTRELRPDELLQMFGRAGRRGLDEWGHVIVTNESPRLHHASPRQLRRINQIDWPTVLRIMEGAAGGGRDPIGEAREAGKRLFSRQSLRLGFEAHSEEDERPQRYGPTREEFLDSQGAWQPVSDAPEAERPTRECLARRQDRWRPALSDPEVVKKLGPGRLCKLRTGRAAIYGKEMTVGNLLADGKVKPAAWLRRQLHLGGREIFSIEELWETAIPLLRPTLPGAEPVELVPRGAAVGLLLDMGGMPMAARRDGHGQWLVDPPRRRVALETPTAYAAPTGLSFNPAPGTAARAWRKLGLVDERGVPTTRGRVFSRFQAGEGLMIAAALEDPAYAVEDIVRHLANLRGGPRFAELSGKDSERLALTARALYGHVDFEGYLAAGLCEGYGEGTWEALELHATGGARALGDAPVGAGDIERARLEWQSLLRHIVHAPNPAAPRWDELQEAAKAALQGERPHLVEEHHRLPALLRQPRRAELRAGLR